METMIYEIDIENIKKNYNIKEINKYIEETITRLEITKTGENKYYGVDTSIDAFMLILGKENWFIKNVKKWEITRHEENITDYTEFDHTVKIRNKRDVEFV